MAVASYSYSTTTTTTSSSGSAIGLIIFSFVILVAVIVGIVTLWKIFTKAGKPGWASLIPFYNYYMILKIVNRPGWWLLWYLIPLAGFIVSIMVMLDLAKAFGRSALFAVLGLIFTPIGYFMLAFGKSQYIGIDRGSGAAPTPPTVPTPPVAPIPPAPTPPPTTPVV